MLPVRSFLAGTSGRLDVEPCLICGSSEIGFLVLYMMGFKFFVRSSGLFMSRLCRSLTDSLGQEVKARLHHHFVLYNEDHHPNHVVCYCPQFYMRSILTTWDDPATFESVQGSPKHWQQEMLKSMPSKLFRRYARAINPEAELPRGTVFLKRKKQFQKGSTIISYSGSSCSKLLQLASIVNNYGPHIVP